MAFLLCTELCFCSSRRYRRVSPTAPQPLIIEDKKYSFDKFVSRPVVYRGNERFSGGEDRVFDPIALRLFYKMAESDQVDDPHQAIYDVDSFPVEIFEMNQLYSYTPAEWSIHNNKMRVFQLFIDRSFKLIYGGSRVEIIGRHLMAMAIQYNNFEAASILVRYANLDYFGKGFLSIAAQHNASPELFRLLLDTCRLYQEVDQASVVGKYPKPLDSCVKFSNPRAAVLLLERGAFFGGRSVEERDESILAQLIVRRKIVMLEAILKEIPSLCGYKDFQGSTLFHYAAIYSTNSDMIHWIHGLCPGLPIDSQNLEHMTPFLTLLTSVRGETTLTEALALEFIIFGANPLISSVDHINPLDLIIKDSLFTIFKLIIGRSPLNLFSTGILRDMVNEVSRSKLWSWLDVLLGAFPGINVDWINFSEVTFEDLLFHVAYLSFEKALRKNALQVPTNCLQLIAQSGNTEFVLTALKNGFKIDSVDVSELCCLEGELDMVMMIEFIRKLQREREDIENEITLLK